MAQPCNCRVCTEELYGHDTLHVGEDEMAYSAVLSDLTDINRLVEDLESRHVPPVTMWCPNKKRFALNLYPLLAKCQPPFVPQNIFTFLMDSRGLRNLYDLIGSG